MTSRLLARFSSRLSPSHTSPPMVIPQDKVAAKAAVGTPATLWGGLHGRIMAVVRAMTGGSKPESIRGQMHIGQSKGALPWGKETTEFIFRARGISSASCHLPQFTPSRILRCLSPSAPPSLRTHILIPFLAHSPPPPSPASQVRDPAALGAWAKEMVPDTIAEAWSIIMICLVGTFAVSCVQVGVKGVGGGTSR